MSINTKSITGRFLKRVRYGPIILGKAHDFVLKAGGEFLNTLIIGDEMYDELIDASYNSNAEEDFLEACRNVRPLSLVEKSGVWASALGMQLEQLQVVTSNPTDVIAKRCPSLLELNFRYFVKAIYHLPYMLTSGIDWKHIGAKLELLTFSGFLLSQDELKRMRIHCKNLRHISICSFRRKNRNMAGFITSYGDQLVGK